MDYVFKTDKVLCVNIAGSPNVIELAAGTVASTIHEVAVCDDLDSAITCAQEIDPAFEYPELRDIIATETETEA